MSSVNAVAQRLSLRLPQRESLEIIGKIADSIPMKKLLGEGIDPAEALAKIKAVIPEAAELTSFEDRTFPTVCLSLATAVGKTRLMAAIIAYLYSVKKVRNFFVLAPNLTIYNKLIRDFTQGSSKYVFTGLGGLFPERPEIVTGENYDAGRGAIGTSVYEQDVVINIFNISKINSEERANGKPRIREMNEIIGLPYFQYLAKLPDLVMLMDESHRYRGDAGLKALCQLNPVLGIELTATPHTTLAGRKVNRFQNIVYDFPLSKAIDHGFVKQPAVAKRQNFDPRASESEIELAKLEDGIHLHENTKTELELYAKQNGLRRVKPFVLIVARDITHANDLERRITDAAFLGGRYADKVITVTSEAGEGKEEKDDLVQKLLTVEDPENKVEIVIHVNMLKEGWDVNNLFTIVPLRRFDSITLVEQSMGRGLRLPYGKRTGVPSVDKLNIVAHEHFKEIVDLATAKKLSFQTTIIGVDVPTSTSVVTRVPSLFEQRMGVSSTPDVGTTPAPVLVVPQDPTAPAPVVLTPQVQGLIPHFQSAVAELSRSIGSSSELLKPDNLATLTKMVEHRAIGQQTIDAVIPAVDLKAAVKMMTETHIATNIDVPRILLHPINLVKFSYRPFTVDCRAMNHNPTTEAILTTALDTLVHQVIQVRDEIHEEPVDHLVGHLMTIKQIDYDESINELLFDLANQVINHLRTRLGNEDDLRNVVRNNAKAYADVVYQQMRDHMDNVPIEYEVKVSTGAMPWNPAHISIQQGITPRDFRLKTERGMEIRSQVFAGFTRCISQAERFDSDPERVFAVICEQVTEPVRAWSKPFRGQVQIHLRDGGLYEPDFIVETHDEKLLVEVKAENELDTVPVREKRDAAVLWCAEATRHSQVRGGKNWTYLLIPHNGFDETWTLAGLKAKYAVSAQGIYKD